MTGRFDEVLMEMRTHINDLKKELIEAINLKNKEDIAKLEKQLEEKE